MAAKGNGDPPVLDLRTMKELCQLSLNGRGGTFMKKRPEDCYDLIENMTTHHNNWDTSAQRSESSSSITSSSDPKIAAVKAKMAEINNDLMRVLQNFQHQNRNQGNIHPQGNNQGRNRFFQGASHVPNPPPAYQAPAYPSLERETEVTKEAVHPTNNGSIKDVQPPVVQVETLILNSEPVFAPVIEPIVAPSEPCKWISSLYQQD
nr:reverse transcriptase domain-containing protein [Tanacetum cinerariifolium]